MPDKICACKCHGMKPKFIKTYLVNELSPRFSYQCPRVGSFHTHQHHCIPDAIEEWNAMQIAEDSAKE